MLKSFRPTNAKKCSRRGELKVPMKCLFERPFKIQKNGVFLFEKSFFVLEILTFFYYAN